MLGRTARRLGNRLGVLLLVGSVAVGSLVVLDGVGSQSAAAQQSAPAKYAATVLTADSVFAAFKTAGLPADNVQQLAIGGGASDSPATESASWSFSVPDVAPSGGHIMVFNTTERLAKKSDWLTGHGAGYSVTVYQNVILWLDPHMPPQEANRYRQALRAAA
jgi:hypothetical protein